jgi:transposase
MREITFSDDDLKAIAKGRYEHLHPHVQRKMEVLWLKSHGLPHKQIAKLAGVSLRTVPRYLDDYREGGLTQVRRCNGRGPQTVLLNHERSLEEYFWDHPPRNTKEAAKVLAEQTGRRRGLTQVRAFLKAHLGLRYRQVAAIPVPRWPGWPGPPRAKPGAAGRGPARPGRGVRRSGPGGCRRSAGPGRVGGRSAPGGSRGGFGVGGNAGSRPGRRRPGRTRGGAGRCGPRPRAAGARGDAGRGGDGSGECPAAGAGPGRGW